MATSVYDTLVERGYIAQCTNEEEVRKLLDEEKVTFYIGFDPTADSLHSIRLAGRDSPCPAEKPCSRIRSNGCCTQVRLLVG